MVREFNALSKQIRTSQVSQYLLIQKLLKTAEAGRIALDSMPQLKKYAQYLSEFLDLEFDGLIIELERLEDKVYEKSLDSEDARKVRAIDRFLGLLGNAYKLQMSSHDYGMLSLNEKDFATESWLAFLNQKLAESGLFESLVPLRGSLEEARKDLGHF